MSVKFHIAGIYEIATSTLIEGPVLVVGDVKISIDGGDLVDLTNLPTARASHLSIIDVVLTDDENVPSAVVTFKDPEGLWHGPFCTGPFEEPTAANQAIIISRLYGTPVNVVGPPLRNGVLELVKNKDYLISNGNALGLSLAGSGGTETADAVLLSIRHRRSLVKEIDRLAATSFDAVNQTATFEIDGTLLDYDFGGKYEYMIELQHGDDFQAPIIGNHILLDDIAA